MIKNVPGLEGQWTEITPQTGYKVQLLLERYLFPEARFSKMWGEWLFGVDINGKWRPLLRTHAPQYGPRRCYARVA